MSTLSQNPKQPGPSSPKAETPPRTPPPATAKEAAVTAPAHPPATLTEAKPAPSEPKKGPLFYLLLIVGLVAFAAAFYFFGIAPRVVAKKEVNEEQKLSVERTVIYAQAKLSAPKTELSLPGMIQAFQQASIYARTNGYVKRWLVDIGQLVHEGDLLAELDTPEVDQQLLEAKATAEKAKATLDIAQSSADRWNGMVAAHAVSKQEADEKNATRNEAKATLDAALATVARLSELQNFKQIRAPFTGTITKRDIEVGNLVSSGNGTGTHELYRIAQTDPLRVYVDVPEANTRSIREGVKASIQVSSYPDRVFEGQVVRDAGAIDSASHTLRTEVDVANKEGILLPGTFAQVKLALMEDAPTVLIPANTLIVNAAGTQVARLEDLPDGKNPDHFKVSVFPVRVGRDFGTEVEIVDGLHDGDRLVANPSSDLTDGMLVTGRPLPPKPGSPSPSPGITASAPPKS